jgi:hypothetical protein
MKLLEEQIEQLLAKAQEADRTPLAEGLSVPEEIRRRQDRIAKLKEAVVVIRERTQARRAQELAAYQSKVEARASQEAATGKKPRGRAPQPPQEGPGAQDQYNFTDPPSRVMKAGSGEHFEQSDNAQAAVELQSRLITAAHVTDAPKDKEPLVPTLAAQSPVAPGVGAVLVDSGFSSEAAVKSVEQQADGTSTGTLVDAATKRHKHGPSIEQLEARPEPAPLGPAASMREVMEHRLESTAGKKLSTQRKPTIEPVFGIIKAAMGFRRFSLRGLGKVNTEWTLVSLSDNLKRLLHLGAALQAA